MIEIIFWFSSHKIRNYWLDYAIDYCHKKGLDIQCNNIESWIEILEVRILFRVDIADEQSLAGDWDKNQYWVEDLFDNNFEEFFITFIKKIYHFKEKKINNYGRKY